ncbi:MAG: c-type cytochrome [Gemmatimonadaceae bacterium]
MSSLHAATIHVEGAVRAVSSVVAIAMLSGALNAQPPGRWPPDSLVNTQVIPRTTPVTQVIGQMRNFAAGLGVRCQFCHVGEEGMPLERFDFAVDEKGTKLVARHMMRMVQEINKRLDSIPGRATPGLQVTCETCHRGVSRPVPLFTLLIDAATAAGADSAIRAYRALRERYYGDDAYDFREPTLSIAAFRLGRANRFDDAFALLRLNEELFPGSSAMYVFRGNINLLRADTVAAAAAFREAIRRDPANEEARGRLRDIGQRP